MIRGCHVGVQKSSLQFSHETGPSFSVEAANIKADNRATYLGCLYVLSLYAVYFTERVFLPRQLKCHPAKLTWSKRGEVGLM